MSYKEGGLNRNRYQVKRADRTPIEQEAEFFVLRVDNDPHARVALAAYAESVRADNLILANQLRGWLTRLHVVENVRRENGTDGGKG